MHLINPNIAFIDLNLSKSIKSTLKGRFVSTVLKPVFTSLINQVLNDLILVENQR